MRAVDPFAICQVANPMEITTAVKMTDEMVSEKPLLDLNILGFIDFKPLRGVVW